MGRSSRSTALTPENYTRAVISLSRRYSSISTFPGNNFAGLGGWMREDSLLKKIEEDANAPETSEARKAHDLVVVYSTGGKRWDMQQYGQDQHGAFTTDTQLPEEGLGQLVFIRGFISPSWVSAIGSKYNIDPEFFRRHMDFLSASIERHAFSFPSLASCSSNIFRLCVSTILHRDDFGGQDLALQRSTQAAELGTYKMQQLASTRVCCGDSLVREYSTLCPCFSVLEQWVSLYVTKTEKGWAVITWMDNGRPLEQSPPGPWMSHMEMNQATPLPVLQHHPKMAFRTTTNRLEPDANEGAAFQQTTSLLPLQYDSLLALVDLARRAPQEPVALCVPLFAHAAFAEVQFLNLVESRIQDRVNAVAEGRPSDVEGDDAPATFQYFSSMLNRHAQQLRDTRRALESLSTLAANIHHLHQQRSGSRTPTGMPRSPSRTPLTPPIGPGRTLSSESTESGRNIRSAAGVVGSSESGGGTFTAKGLLDDYEQLHERCVALAGMCTWGITLAMNKATIDESRKAIEQSGRLKKLTILATFFIPLGFSSSLFGMNIDLLGQSSVALWWFFVICAPITVMAYLFYLWDYEYLKRHCVRLWKVCRQKASRGDAEVVIPGRGRSEKDPSHLV